MSAFKQSMRKLGVRAGLLAGASAAVLAISGVGATSALAAPTCPSNAVSAIEGQGSSLQRISQELWTGREVPSNEFKGIPHTLKTGGYASFCGTSPSVSYTSTGSGAALTALRYNGTGVIENGTHTGETHGFAFGGSDDGPTTAQIENAEAATTGGVATGANALIIPVAQTSIAVVVDAPEGCTLTSNSTHGLSYAELNKIFSGTLKTWSELASATGTCSGAITRVVREDGSGTTTQFKNYLAELETGKSAEGPGCGLGTWASLRQIENAATGAPNTTWPECTGRSTVVRKKGGGGVAGYVAETHGTIGYAALPDAKSKGATVARLQNQSAGIYALPEGSTGETANCGSRVYTVPTPGREGESGESVNWSTVFGASPGVGGTLYPLCTLTYDLSWTSYSKAGYANPAATAEDVKAYINYILNEGQSIGHYYQAVPSPTEKEHNVLAAAKLAASKIG